MGLNRDVQPGASGFDGADAYERKLDEDEARAAVNALLNETLPAPDVLCDCGGNYYTDAQVVRAQTKAYAAGRQDEREAAIAHFEKVARETDDQSPLGKAHWCRAAAHALRNGWHS